MGSGKSTIGKKLAAKLGWPFCDTDTMLEESMSMPVAEIFNTYGEVVFRQKEKEIIEKLKMQTNLVVSCGGGVPCFGNNLQILKQSGVVIYLKMPPEALVMRLKKAKSERPLLKNLNGEQLVDKIVSLLGERGKFYDQAHIVFSGISVNLNGLIERINNYFNEVK